MRAGQHTVRAIFKPPFIRRPPPQSAFYGLTKGLPSEPAAEPRLVFTELLALRRPSINLCAVRRRMGNRAGAKDAYEKMRDEAHDLYKRDDKNTEALLQEVYALALLGRVDDARDVLTKARKKHPENRQLNVFSDSRQFDRILEDPAFKELAL